MSFLVFKLLFAALALGLLVVLGLTARQLLRQRGGQPPAPRAEAAPKAPKLRMPSLPRKQPEAEPVPEAPPPPRRRQLASFAEAERAATTGETEGEAAVVSPAPADPAPPEPEHEPAPEPASEQVPSEPPVAEPSPSDAPTLDQAVLGRLEAAFDALQAGELSLDAYRAQVETEQATVEQHIASLEASGGGGAELEAALAARESVRWCLDWADEQNAREDAPPRQ